MSGPRTPAELGFTADDMWEFVSPRHALLRLPGDDGVEWYTDAVMVASSAEGFLVCLPLLAAPEEEVTMLPADGGEPEALQDIEGTLSCVYVLLPLDGFQEWRDPVPVGAAYAMFGEPGQSPLIGDAVVHAPLELFPEDVATAVQAHADGDAELLEFLAQPPEVPEA